MEGNFRFHEAKCNPKVFLNEEWWKQRGETKIPLQFKVIEGDSASLDMSPPQFLKTQCQLALLMIFTGFSHVMAADSEKESTPEKTEEIAKPEQKDGEQVKADEGANQEVEKKELDPDDEAAVEEADAEAAVKALPVSPDPVQIYGWREKIVVDGMENSMNAKLDTGAYTSSIHAEEKELFERDGKKWVRFIVTEPRKKDSPRVKLEAPLVRIARIKDPGGESETREVVKLAFKIGDRKLRGDFTLNDRSNMLSPILIGRITIRELGWIDPSRTNLAEDKIMR